MIKVKKSHLWLVLSVVMACVRGDRENFILSITVSGSGSGSVFVYYYYFFAFTNERKSVFVVFVSSVVHTHTQKYTDGKVHKNKKRQKS